MSALGQKQTFAPQKAMSALLPIATAKADSTKHVCFTLKSRHVRCTNRRLLRANSGLARSKPVANGPSRLAPEMSREAIVSDFGACILIEDKIKVLLLVLAFNLPSNRRWESLWEDP